MIEMMAIVVDFEASCDHGWKVCFHFERLEDVVIGLIGGSRVIQNALRLLSGFSPLASYLVWYAYGRSVIHRIETSCLSKNLHKKLILTATQLSYYISESNQHILSICNP